MSLVQIQPSKNLLTNLQSMARGRYLLLIWIAVLVLVHCQDTKEKAQEEVPQGRIVAQYVKYFFPKLCYQKYFAKGMFNAPQQCYLTITSRLLSLLNTIVVFFIRIPQIVKIIKSKSTFGLSYFGNNLQFVMPAMTLGYGIYAKMPISIYIENLFIAGQSLIVLCLFFKYREPNYEQQTNQMKLMFITSMAVSGLFIFQLVPNYMQEISIWLQLVVFFFGRGSQLLANYKNKSTGTLSMLTVMITVSANCIRVFSIVMEAPGNLGYLLNYLIPFFVNGYILFQFYLYKDNQLVTQHKKEKNQ